MNPDTIPSSLPHPLLVYYAAAVLIIVPMIRIFERAGFKPWWALFLAVPAVGHILCIAALVLQRWPVLPPRVKRKKS